MAAATDLGPEVHQLDCWKPRAQAVRSRSGAWTGSLKLRSGDLELDGAIGPEVTGAAPVPYDYTIASDEPIRAWRRTIGRLEVSVCSDLASPSDEGFSYGYVGLHDLDFEIAPDVRLRAAGLSTRCLVSKDRSFLTGGIDVMLRDATLEVDGLDPIELPSGSAANTVVGAEVLAPRGLRLVVNEQRIQPVDSLDRTILATAVRLSFERSVTSGRRHAGVAEIAVTMASLGLLAPRRPRGVPRPENTGFISVTRAPTSPVVALVPDLPS